MGAELGRQEPGPGQGGAASTIWMTADRRRAFRIVEDFEAAVADYTGAPHVVTVDSCTNALFLALRYHQARDRYGAYVVGLPKRTYVGVAQAVRNAGLLIRWDERRWTGTYAIDGTRVIDAAKQFTSRMYVPGTQMCVSFQAGKILPIGRGGAILTDEAEAAAWLRRARFDGRSPDDDRITTPGYHMYLDPPSAARGLWLMTYLAKDNPDQVDEYDDLSQMEAFR